MCGGGENCREKNNGVVEAITYQGGVDAGSAIGSENFQFESRLRFIKVYSA